LNADEALMQARVRMITTHHDEVIAEYTLAQALGQATARGLNLMVKYYDPSDYLTKVRDRWFGFGNE